MTVDLFAGIYVRDYASSKEWYSKLLGAEPSFIPTDNEAVWEISEHRFLYIVERREHAGHSVCTIIVGGGELNGLISEISERGIEPARRETYSNGTRKVTYRDGDGNEVGYGGAPQ